jgi:hypothetical protein
MVSFIPALLLTLTVLLLPVRLSATCGAHPDDSGATLIDAFTVSLPVSSLTSVLGPTRQSGSGECRAVVDVCVFRTSSGRIDLILSPGTMHFEGNCEGYDTIATGWLVGRLSLAAIGEAIVRGDIPSPDSCITEAGTRPRVYSPACLQRSISLGTTWFLPCTTAYCHREYVICSPEKGGPPSITPLPGNHGQCIGTSGCDSACP